MSTAFEKVWQTDANRRIPPTECTTSNVVKYTLWYLKAVLKNAGLGITSNPGAWTVYTSCDGTTAGTTGDGVDRWGDTYDRSKLVHANGSGAHAWMVLTKSIGGFQWYVLLELLGTSDRYCRVYFSCTNAFTGGTTTSRPTSATEWHHWAGSVQDYDFDCGNGSDFAHVLHSNLSTDGNWMLYSAVTGTGWIQSTLGFQAFSTVSGTLRSGDQCPGVSFFGSQGLASSSRVWASSGFQSMAGSSTSPRTIAGRNTGNTAAEFFVALVPSMAGAVLFSLGVNAINRTDPADGSVPDWPMVLYDDSAQSLRARITDIAWAPPGNAEGLVEPQAAPFRSVIFGNTWHPWLTNQVPNL